MKSPFTGGSVELKKEKANLSFRKESFSVVYHYYECADTGESFTVDELDELNLSQVHNMYRFKYGIPFVEEIKALRHKYGLSAAKMSDVLGFGTNVYRQYEAGEMPTVANGRLIKLAEDPEEFRRLVHMCRHSLEDDEYQKVLQKLHNAKEARNKGYELQERWLLGNHCPNVYNGFRVPNLKKLLAMVHFFAHHNQPFVTAMNKLLFYADFGHFKQYAYSISGASYMAIERGPVPDSYGAIYTQAVKGGFIEVKEEDFGDYVGERFLTNEFKFTDYEDLFSNSEIEVLQKVSAVFKGKSTKQIVGISHEEDGWKQNANQQNHINFMYSFYLKHI